MINIPRPDFTKTKSTKCINDGPIESGATIITPDQVKDLTSNGQKVFVRVQFRDQTKARAELKPQQDVSMLWITMHGSYFPIVVPNNFVSNAINLKQTILL